MDYTLSKNTNGISLQKIDAKPAQELIAKIIQSQDRLPSTAHRHGGAFISLNKNGLREPIFWCFNNWVEPFSLAHHIGPDQPIYATRSLHTLVSGKAAKKSSLPGIAAAMAQETLELRGSAPKVLGGNCQAAPIVEAIAHKLVAAGEPPPRLIIMEHELDYYYPGHVMYLFGSLSERFNPFLQGRDPIETWSNQHKTVAHGFLNAQHGQYFRKPAIDELCAYIRHFMEDAARGAAPQTGLVNRSVISKGGSDQWR